MRSRAARGFSLLELIIAIAVQAILVLILLFSGSDVLNDIQGPKGQRAQKDAAMIAMGLWGLNEDANGYVGDNGVPAGGLSGMTISTTLASPGSAKNATTLLGVTGGWNGPYIGVSLNAQGGDFDPWENKWRITADGTVVSAGPDGIVPSGDDIAGFNGINAQKNSSGPMGSGEFGTLSIQIVDQFGAPITHNGDCTYAQNYLVMVTNPTPAGTTGMGNLIVTCQNTDTTMPPYVMGPATPMGATTGTWTGLWPGQHAVQVIGAPQVQGSGQPVSVCDGTSNQGTLGGTNPGNSTLYGPILQLMAGNYVPTAGTATNGAVPIQGSHPYTCALNCTGSGATGESQRCQASSSNEQTLGVYGFGIGYVIGGGSSTVTIRLR